MLSERYRVASVMPGSITSCSPANAGVSNKVKGPVVVDRFGLFGFDGLVRAGTRASTHRQQSVQRHQRLGRGGIVTSYHHHIPIVTGRSSECTSLSIVSTAAVSVVSPPPAPCQAGWATREYKESGSCGVCSSVTDRGYQHALKRGGLGESRTTNHGPIAYGTTQSLLGAARLVAGAGSATKSTRSWKGTTVGPAISSPAEGQPQIIRVFVRNVSRTLRPGPCLLPMQARLAQQGTVLRH